MEVLLICHPSFSISRAGRRDKQLPKQYGLLLCFSCCVAFSAMGIIFNFSVSNLYNSTQFRHNRSETLKHQPMT